MWASLAKYNGYQETDPIVLVIKPRMTKAQIEKAQRLAQVCLDSNYQDCIER